MKEIIYGKVGADGKTRYWVLLEANRIELSPLRALKLAAMSDRYSLKIVG